MINDFKDQPKVLREIMDKIEFDISCEQYCYYSERDLGGKHEIDRSDAGRREMIAMIDNSINHDTTELKELMHSKDWEGKNNA